MSSGSSGSRRCGCSHDNAQIVPMCANLEQELKVIDTLIEDHLASAVADVMLQALIKLTIEKAASFWVREMKRVFQSHLSNMIIAHGSNRRLIRPSHPPLTTQPRAPFPIYQDSSRTLAPTSVLSTCARPLKSQVSSKAAAEEDRKRHDWTEAEEMALQEAMKLFGGSIRHITEHLGTRTYDQVKSKVRTMVLKEKRSGANKQE